MHSLRHGRLIAAALVLLLFAHNIPAAEPLSEADRQALREFRVNRLFSMLGYLEQRATNEAFPWNKVGFSEVGNAWSGVNEEGEKLAAPVRAITAEHEAQHRQTLLQEVGRLLAGSLEGEGVKALAKVELTHAAADIEKVDRLLAGEPPPTADELELLRQQESDLLKKFKPFIPGLVAVNGGFAQGGSYCSSQYSDPAQTPYLSEVSGPPAAPAARSSAKDDSPSPRDKALAEAREALARARVLADFLTSSRKKLASQLQEAREPLKDGQAACALLDAAMKRSEGLSKASAEVNRELLALMSVTAKLEQSYISLAEQGQGNSDHAATICGYAQKAEKTPGKLVQTWKAEANKTIHEMSQRIEHSQTKIDEARAELVERRVSLTTAVRILNTYDAMNLVLPLIPTLEASQDKIRSALKKGEATEREMHAAYREIQQLRGQIHAVLSPFADEEAERLYHEAKDMDMKIPEPQSVVREVHAQVFGTSGAAAVTSLNPARYARLEETLRKIDIDRVVALARSALDEAEAVESVGESKRAPAYQGLKQALECYAKIKGGTAEPAAPPSAPPKSTPAKSDKGKAVVQANGGWNEPTAELTEAYIRFYIEPEKKNFYVMLSASKYPFPVPPVAGKAYASFAKRFLQASCNAPYDGSATSGRLIGTVKGKRMQEYSYSATGDHTKTELKHEQIGEVSFQINATLKDGRVKGTAVGGGQTYSFDVPVK